MKAERRHELQTNALAKFLSDLPLYFRFHFGKIVLGVVIVALGIILIRQRITSGRVRGLESIENLNESKRLISQLPMFDLMEPDSARRAAERKRTASQAEGLLEQILASTRDPDDAALRAEAYVARGDLYWSLANLPEVPGATTQPALRAPRTAEDYLRQAEEAYQHVLSNYPDRATSIVTARFGLAAIAENRNNWEQARAQYQAILQQADLPATTRMLATQRMEYLSRLREPLYTGNVTSQPATEPATQPATQPDLTTP